mgnify:CR=1 FL=1
MGQDKLGLPWRGTTILETTIKCWTAVTELDGILLVRRHHHATEQWPRVQLLVNPNPDEGMGGSLRLAAEALPPDTEAVVIGLADMPEIAPGTISALIAAWRPLGIRGIVAPEFDDRRGHPVIFGAGHFPALRELSGDQGARSVIQRCAADLLLVPVDDPGVIVDLDTPSDLEARS